MKYTTLLCLLVLVSLCPVAGARGGAEAVAIPKEKRTVLGLYLTPAQAYEKWKSNPETVKILDVRTPDEYVFVGHPTMAWHIPLALQTYQWDATGRMLPMKPNPDFLAHAKEVFTPADTLLVLCRSGGRSAKAVDALAGAGFKQVYNIVDGVEGDLIQDPKHPDHGKRKKNGWINSGLPWTYELDPAKMRLPAQPAPPSKQ
ncbi:MAG: rhodanese-like domain-containing protein [Thermoanaerobaculia bacterium]